MRSNRFQRVSMVAVALLITGVASGQTTYKTIDTETLELRTVDTLVTCPLEFASYVSGGNEGCPTGRAPATGECGLSWDCTVQPTVADAVQSADHWWAHVIVIPMVLDLGSPAAAAVKVDSNLMADGTFNTAPLPRLT